MTYEDIRKNAVIEALINKGNNNLGMLGYTEHGKAHGTLVAQRAAYVLNQLGYSEYGALLANSILEKTDLQQ